MLETGRNCWRIARADRAALIVDAADYFRLARQAMLEARSQILMIGWDFDTRISLDPAAEGDIPDQLGPFVSWLSDNRKDLAIHILKWDLGAIKLLGRGSTVFRLVRWAADDNIHFKLDGAHPAGASHHQKILVIDDTLAFCGGIDMTADRWDTRGHCDEDARRKRPTTGRVYMPWHDATMAVDGEAARALGELARNRWEAAGADPLRPPKVPGTDPWPPALDATFRDVDVAIARTRGAYKDLESIREIEALYLDMIERAQRFIYAENQFFGSRLIARAIAKRLAEPDGPQFVIVNPCTVDGWLEEEVMSPARQKLMKMLARHDRYGRFRMYTPVTEGRDDIYVHSKITIVDDETLRVGSANMNNRSLGLDSECDLIIDTRLPANADVGPRIARIRCDLLAEHLGVAPEEVEAKLAETQSLIATVEALRGDGRTLVPFEPEEPDAVGETLAESEILDPESGGDEFEPIARPGLLTGLF